MDWESGGCRIRLSCRLNCCSRVCTRTIRSGSVWVSSKSVMSSVKLESHVVSEFSARQSKTCLESSPGRSHLGQVSVSCLPQYLKVLPTVFRGLLRDPMLVWDLQCSHGIFACLKINVRDAGRIQAALGLDGVAVGPKGEGMGIFNKKGVEL